MYVPHFRKKRNNVPILRKNEIDEIAEEYVFDYCPEAVCNPQPIDIDFFIEGYLGLTLDYHFLSNNGMYLGMTVFNDTSKIPVFIPEEGRADYLSASSGTVIIDTFLTTEDNINRYRYTCGHEAGHWIFHRAFYDYNPNQLTLFEMDVPYMVCRELSPKELIPNANTWDDMRWMEWHADKFSSCFLMPKTAVINLIRQADISTECEARIIHLVSAAFQVSEAAAMYRLMDLGILRSSTQKKQLSFI